MSETCEFVKGMQKTSILLTLFGSWLRALELLLGFLFWHVLYFVEQTLPLSDLIRSYHAVTRQYNKQNSGVIVLTMVYTLENSEVSVSAEPTSLRVQGHCCCKQSPLRSVFPVLALSLLVC